MAYAVFAENGNIRVWATESQHVKRIAAEQGLKLVKLYAHPSPPEGMEGGWMPIETAPTQDMIAAVLQLVDLEQGDVEDHRYDDGSKLAEQICKAVLALVPQPAPSAAVVVNPDPHAELRKTWQPGQRWQARSFRNGQWGPWTDAVASEPFWFPHQDYRRHPDDLAPQPSPTPQADSAQDEFISREQWVERAMRVYLIAGDTEDEARECAEYQWGELDMDDIPDPYFTAMEDIEGRGPAPQADSQPAPPELLKFYGVTTDAELIAAQARHIERLQAKLPQTPSFAPQQVREG